MCLPSISRSAAPGRIRLWPAAAAGHVTVSAGAQRSADAHLGGHDAAAAGRRRADDDVWAVQRSAAGADDGSASDAAPTLRLPALTLTRCRMSVSSAQLIKAVILCPCLRSLRRLYYAHVSAH